MNPTDFLRHYALLFCLFDITVAAAAAAAASRFSHVQPLFSSVQSLSRIRLFVTP